MTDSNTESKDLFSESDDWIAAETRQLFRAFQAKDLKAIEMSSFYFQDFLVKTLARHLRKDPHWDSNGRWLDGLGGDITQEIQPPTFFRIRSDMIWATKPNQDCWYREPFEFEIELWPMSGALSRYIFRFGDHRPLVEKELRSPTGSSKLALPGDNLGWSFIFQRGEKT
jgi:hypothetical protein